MVSEILVNLGEVFFIRPNYGKTRGAANVAVMPYSCTARPLESIFILKAVDSISNERPYLALQDAHAHYWVHYLISEEFQSAGPSMPQLFAVD